MRWTVVALVVAGGVALGAIGLLGRDPEPAVAPGEALSVGEALDCAGELAGTEVTVVGRISLLTPRLVTLGERDLIVASARDGTRASTWAASPRATRSGCAGPSSSSIPPACCGASWGRRPCRGSSTTSGAGRCCWPGRGPNAGCRRLRRAHGPRGNAGDRGRRPLPGGDVPPHHPRIQPGSELYTGPAPGRGRGLYALFLRACNDGDAPVRASDDVVVRDAFGEAFAPRPEDVAAPFRYAPSRAIRPGTCAPAEGSAARSRFGGGALVFEIPLQDVRETPLVMEIRDGTERGRLELRL